MTTPSFPSERKRVRAPRTGLLTCAFSSHLPKNGLKGLASSGFVGPSALGGNTLAEFLPSSDDPNPTATEAEALTVAGQWRTFTAFPSILAIAVVNCAAP